MRSVLHGELYTISIIFPNHLNLGTGVSHNEMKAKQDGDITFADKLSEKTPCNSEDTFKSNRTQNDEKTVNRNAITNFREKDGIKQRD